MIIVVEVETSVTVEGQTDTQTATVQQGTQGPKGTSYLEEHCPILMYNKDPDLDHSFADWQRPGAGSEALRCCGGAQQREIARHHRVRLVSKKHRAVGWGGCRAGKAPQACLAADPVPEAYARNPLALLL